MFVHLTISEAPRDGMKAIAQLANPYFGLFESGEMAAPVDIAIG
jgi:hypothetical protein